MTPLDEMVETFKNAALCSPHTSINDGLLAVLDKHIRQIIANAHEDGVRAGRSDVMMSNHNDYAAARLSELKGEGR